MLFAGLFTKELQHLRIQVHRRSGLAQFQTDRNVFFLAEGRDLIAARDQLIAEQTEMDRIDSRERREVADTEADRASMASQRWADAAPDPDETPGRRWTRLAPDNGGKR